MDSINTRKRFDLSTRRAWQVRFITLTLLVIMVGGGSQALTNALASAAVPPQHTAISTQVKPSVQRVMLRAQSCPKGHHTSTSTSRQCK